MKNIHPHNLVQGQADDADRLAALRQAAQEGITDINAGRFKTFVTKQELRKHLQAIAAKAPTVIHQAR
jgi:antitoxin ParD1/3/4